MNCNPCSLKCVTTDDCRKGSEVVHSTFCTQKQIGAHTQLERNEQAGKGGLKPSFAKTQPFCLPVHTHAQDSRSVCPHWFPIRQRTVRRFSLSTLCHPAQSQDSGKKEILAHIMQLLCCAKCTYLIRSNQTNWHACLQKKMPYAIHASCNLYFFKVVYHMSQSAESSTLWIFGHLSKFVEPSEHFGQSQVKCATNYQIKMNKAVPTVIKVTIASVG